MPYIGSQPTKVVSQQSSRVYRYTATAGQTVFSGADVDNQVLNVTPSDVEVHMNGLLLDATDYTVTSSSVTLGAAANSGDELTITGMVTFEVADTYNKTTADARYVNASGDTMTGALTITETSNQALNLTTTGLGSQVVYQSSSTNTPWYTGIAGNANDDFLIYQGATANAGDIYMYTNSYERMRVHKDGYVTMPYQPAFSEPAYTNHSVTTAVDVYMTSSNVFADTISGTQTNVGNHWNASTGRFTAPVAGYYQFILSYSVIFSSGYFYVYLKKNGSTMAYAPTNQDGDWEHRTLSTIIHMHANDYMQGFWTNNYSGGNIGHCHFSGRLVS